MQAGHRLGHRFAGLVSAALILVAAVLWIRVHGALLRRTAGRLLAHPGDSPRLPPTRVADWLAVHQPERSFS